jgi:hypothetical protein
MQNERSSNIYDCGTDKGIVLYLKGVVTKQEIRENPLSNQHTEYVLRHAEAPK